MGNHLIYPAGGKAAHKIENSLIFNDNDNPNLSRTFAAGDRKTWTASVWVKRANLNLSTNYMMLINATTGANSTYITFYNDFIQQASWIGSSPGQYDTPFYRDPTAWMHIVVATDTTLGSDRVKIWVNGVVVHTIVTEYVLNYEGFINHNILHTIGKDTSGRYFDGYMAEWVFIDGDALTPDSFGEFHPHCPQIWRPIDVSNLDYSGTNSFHLDFKDATSTTTLGYDVSGNDNHFTLTNLAVTDQSTDTPTNNCCTANSIDRPDLNDTPILTQGNKNVKGSGASNYTSRNATFGVSSGKWYFEFKVLYQEYESGTYIGVIHESELTEDASNGEQWILNADNANTDLYKKYQGTPTTISSWGNFAVNDILQCAFDMDTGKIWFGHNNSWIEGDPSAGTGESYSSLHGTVLPRILQVGLNELMCQFTDDEFSYTPPTDFKSLCANNLPVPPILNPRKYVDVNLYTGDASSRTIPTENKVDHVVTKIRDGTRWWQVSDSVRGIYKTLFWNNAETEQNITAGVNGFGTTNGYDIGTSAGVNELNKLFVSYAFTKSPLAGMDIITFTGNGIVRTLSHSLGVLPELIFIQARTSDLYEWAVYVKIIGATEYFQLNLPDAAVTGSTMWNDTEPTASVITVGTHDFVNKDTIDYVAYLYASIEGFSKVFRYIGNGNADGAFIFCGFMPIFIMIKRDGNTSWYVFDTERNTYNPVDLDLNPDNGTVEGTTTTPSLDAVSNGFKIRTNHADLSTLASPFYGIAFADFPFALLNNSEI